MISEKQAKRYCREDISKIGNYEEAVNDKEHKWDCHHCFEKFWWWETSPKDLKEQGMYYNRPASELIFLSASDHRTLHTKGRECSEETKRKLSEINKNRSKEISLRMSRAHKGKHPTEETKRKISKALKGRRIKEEVRQHMGKHTQGTHWYNDGVMSVRAKECPKGFVSGRLPFKK